MRNVFDISSDGINVYLSLEIKTSRTLKVLLVIVLLFVVVLLGFLFSALDIKEVPKLILPMIIIPVLIFYFLIRYVLWNLFGKEVVIVNRKSISSGLDYGLYKTNLKTILIDRLGFGEEFVREFELVRYGNINFYNYNKLTNLPELIHSTSVELTLEEIINVHDKVSEIFMDDFNEENKFLSFSEN
ncbi:hypothetical protein [Tenacibaculum ovolyticum]|uniref:hypothetical protein n=1 Tax=Tenacibaculum ovolyticum TaxID=104270 RepID=UPI00042060AA|nr:hypothetical protein [Tenacibaculum ovolyticum]